jgi:tetratricopeptide (TPR) repeat protein
MNAAGYHVTNVLMHAAGAVLLWMVLGRLGIPGAWLAAMIFAVHPVNVESVAWVSERKNTLSLIFYMLTVLFYLRYDEERRPRDYGLALGMFVCALLSKTSVVMLAPVLLLCAWWRHGKLDRRDLVGSVPFFALAALMGAVTVWFQYARAMAGEPSRTEGFATQLATAGLAVWFYAYKALLPLGLCTIYPRWSVDGTSVLSFVPGALLIGAFVLAAVHRRGWGRPVLFALGYFAALLFPILGFFDMYPLKFTLVADRWQYLAVIGPIALVTGAGAALLRDADVRWRRAAAGAAVCVLGVLTWVQAGVYRDKETLWRANLEKCPECWMSQYNLGLALDEQGRYEEARARYAKALKLKPEFPDAMAGMGHAMYRQGDADGAMACFRRALEMDEAVVGAHNGLGLALVRKGRAEEALPHYREAIRRKPHFAEGYNNLGVALCTLGRIDEAIGYYAKAVEERPDFGRAHYNLGLALGHRARWDEARERLAEAARLAPDFPEAHYDLANVCSRAGLPGEAADHYRAALRLKPDWPHALGRLAWILATCARDGVRSGKEATRCAEKACELTGGNDARLLDIRAAAYAEAGRLEEAVRSARKARELARAAGRDGLARDIEARAKLYESGRPFRAPSRDRASSSM